MDWMEAVGEAIDYIEDHITDALQVEDVARAVYISPFYFQKGFSLLCGYSVGEYIRNRRLALAGSELLSRTETVTHIALKYGYDSPDSFTKAFTRFHGVTPTAARRDEVLLKSFAPLRIRLSLEGGYLMDYKIVNKDSFTVVGASKTFRYDDAKSEIPRFWREHYQSGDNRLVCGQYGLCIDESMTNSTFEYLIADNYDPARDVPEGLVTKVIPAFTWAVFPCRGAVPASLQAVNQRIFAEWLPSCKAYEIAAGYCVELYDDPAKYPNGMADADYYAELWIPVKKK